jgi:hypothetical protein
VLSQAVKERYNRLNIPIIVNGHVYVGAMREVDVYGLLSQETARKWTAPALDAITVEVGYTRGTPHIESPPDGPVR